MRSLRFVLPALAVALGLVPSAAAAGGPAVEVIATGLNSPRHLEFGADGDLFVAEAGKGGSGPCFIGGEGPACMGNSGSVTKIDKRGRQSRIATGLASYANTPNNDAAIGPHGIEVVGDDLVLVTNGGPTEPKDADGKMIPRGTLAAQNPAADLFGRILLVSSKLRQPVKVADTWAFERDVNPDSNGGNPAIDANPVDLEFDGLGLVFADAGGNSVNRVNLLGRISNIAVFPNRAGVPNPFGGPPVDMQAVPTSVEVAPDGDYLVSQLTGFPFPVGGARIYRVDRRTGKVKVAYDGFTNIMDMAFGKDGTLYVLEIDHNGLLFEPIDGAIFAISRNGQRRQISVPAGALPLPGGITVGRDGLYVTTLAVAPGGGSVVRINGRF
jgi:hypothetical protein